MMLTRRQRNQIRKILLGSLVGVIVQLGFPHVSLAAQENYLALGRGEAMPYRTGLLALSSYDDSYESIVLRNEKITSPAAMAEESVLPLEADEPQVVDEHWLTATAYSSTKDQTDGSPFTTAWGTPVRDGIVAVNFLPLGTLVRFPDLYGDKVFVVEDRMSVRYPYRADIWMTERADAKQFGIKYVRMEELSVKVPRDWVIKNFDPAFPGMR